MPPTNLRQTDGNSPLLMKKSQSQPLRISRPVATLAVSTLQDRQNKINNPSRSPPLAESNGGWPEHLPADYFHYERLLTFNLSSEKTFSWVCYTNISMR